MIKKLLLLTTLCASTMTMNVFASGWTADSNTWHYTDSQGQYITDAWKQSGNDWFYLDNNGNLAVDTLIDDGGKYYYVDEHGKMIKDAWMLLMDKDNEKQRWMYFSSTGKAVTSMWKVINNLHYHFDSDGYMDYGWLDSDGNMIDENTEDAWKTAVYYCGTNSDGHRSTGWLETSAEDTDLDKDDIWVYFDNTGKKMTNKVSFINGKKYRFDENGMMITKWFNKTDSQYYYDDDNGNLIKKGWIYTNKNDNEDDAWYYIDNTGKAVTNQIKKINNKWYAFDNNGKMLTGLVTITDDNNIINQYDIDNVTKDFIANLDTKYIIFKDENDGSAYVNNCKIELADDTYSFKFNSRGLPTNKTGYLYVNGILLNAKNSNYEIINVNGKCYLVNKSGKIMKKGTYKDSTTYLKYVVDEYGNIAEYIY